jgi:hypothetical protein
MRTDRQTGRQALRNYCRFLQLCEAKSKVTMLCCTMLPDIRKHVAVFEGPQALPACPNTTKYLDEGECGALVERD